MKQCEKKRYNVNTKGLWGVSLPDEWHIVTHFETFRIEEADSAFVMKHQCRMVSKSSDFWDNAMKDSGSIQYAYAMQTQASRIK